MTRTFLIPLACALCVQLFPLPGLTAEKPTYVTISHGQLSYELKRPKRRRRRYSAGHWTQADKQRQHRGDLRPI